MKRISSKWIVFHKWVFPILWFGLIAFFLGTALLNEEGRSNPMALVVPIVMAVLGYLLMHKLVWDLVDEVYDGGDHLLVKWKGQEEKVQLSNIININVQMAWNPPRITLLLAQPGLLGKELSFSPITGLRINPFAKNDIAEDLIVRADAARANRP